MRELLSRIGEHGVVLRNMCVDRRSIIRYAVNELVLRVQDFARNVTNSRGYRRREHEGLSFRRGRQKFGDGVNFRAETHVEKSIGFVQDELNAYQL